MSKSPFARLSIAVAASLLSACNASEGTTVVPGPQTSRLAARSRTPGHPILPASYYHVVYSFAGGNDGANPNGDLIDLKGTIYGTAYQGGHEGGRCRGKSGCGVAFSLSASGAEKVLYSFRGVHGDRPIAGFTNVKGTLYGTTYYGGSSNDGAVYSTSTRGREMVLHSFTGYPSDGKGAYAGLIIVNGTLYGTTYEGGSSNLGTVYSISTSGTERVLYSFAGGSDGEYPDAGLLNVNGTLYGTTSEGGSSDRGTVYSISATGAEKVLYSFKGGSDGAYPRSGVLDLNGRLYGTTTLGGVKPECNGNKGCGTVFSLTTGGKEHVLYRFKGYPDDGASPNGLLGVNGTLYATTYGGGLLNLGTVFSVSTSGAEQVLYSFAGGSDGANPFAGLLDVNGALYGATDSGGGSGCGGSGCGTIFALTP